MSAIPQIIFGIAFLVLGALTLGDVTMAYARAHVKPEIVEKQIPDWERFYPINAKPGQVWSLKGGGFAEIIDWPGADPHYLSGLGVYYDDKPHAQEFFFNKWRRDGRLSGTGWTGHELSMNTDKPSVYGGVYPKGKWD